MTFVRFRLGWFCAFGTAWLFGCSKPEASRPSGREGGQPRPVRVARVEVRSVERTIAATGTLGAQEQSTLSSKVAGRLQKLTVDIGSDVKLGDLLAQIEPRDFELRLQQSAAALSQARAELGLSLSGDDDRVDLETVSSVKKAKAVLDESTKSRERIINLSRSGIASASEVDTAEADYRVALTTYETALEEARTRTATLAQRRAEFEIARKQLADTSLLAPYGGTIQNRPASVGEFVSAGTPILTLVKTDPLRLRLEVPERESMLVRAGQIVRLRVEGDTNVHSGRIARLAPAIVEEDRMLRVEADVPNPGGLRAGLFARADIIVNDRDETLTVPTNALAVFAGIEKVVTIKEGKALELIVNTGRRGADWVEITMGVMAGQPVVLDPAGLRSGQSVVVEGGTPADVTSDAGHTSRTNSKS